MDDSASDTLFYDALDEPHDPCIYAAELPEPETVVEWADALAYPIDSVPKVGNRIDQPSTETYANAS
jgi:hypothetical protein